MGPSAEVASFLFLTPLRMMSSRGLFHVPMPPPTRAARIDHHGFVHVALGHRPRRGRQPFGATLIGDEAGVFRGDGSLGHGGLHDHGPMRGSTELPPPG
jgi:hypothetical protein